MTIYTSAMVNQMMMQQTSMFAGQAQYAQTIGMRPMAPPSSMMGVGPRQTGMFGEQVASGMAGFAQGASGVGMAGLGIAGAITGMPTDPFSAAFTGGTAGYAMGGMGGAALGAAGMALPFYAATAYTGALGRNFMGGMQQQFALNSTLRNNFQHFGGQGALGRGFSQQQMGQIGGTVASTLRSNPMTTANELNQLIQGGSEMGMMSGTRDVQTFSQNFRRMISTLRNIQRELGGNLTEALEFARQSQAMGVFGQGNQQAFASMTRGTMATTGMSMGQLTELQGMGANLSMATGGRTAQGARGAMRRASQIGAAANSGILTQEMMSNMTGGLQGAAAVAALTAQSMTATERWSRTAAGRYNMYAMSNADGTGLDAEMVERYQSGDLGISEIRRRAQGNVRGMGRARALNQAGRLRGAMLEEGGMAMTLGHLREQLGDRAMDSGDETVSYLMQRRMGFTADQARGWTSMLRNQGQIAMSERLTQSAATREARGNEVRAERGWEGFTRQLKHGLNESLHMNQAREMGRGLATRISSAIESSLNRFMGVAEGHLSQADHMAMGRMLQGRASQADLARLESSGFRSTRGEGATAGSGWNIDSQGAGQRALSAIGLGHATSLRERMAARGDKGFADRSAVAQMDAVNQADAARRGILTGSGPAQDILGALGADSNAAMLDFSQARQRARAHGDESNYYQYLQGAARGDGTGNGALAMDVFAASRGAAGLDEGGPRVDQGFGGQGGLGSLFGSARTRRDNIQSYVASGGDLVRDTERTAQTARAVERKGHIQGAAWTGVDLRRVGLGALRRARSSDPAEAAAEEARALTAGMSREGLDTLAGNDAVRTQFNQMTAAMGTENFEASLAAFAQTGEGLGSERERSTAAALVAQARHAAGTGQGPGVLNGVLDGTGEQQEAMRRERAIAAGSYRGMGTAFKGLLRSGGGSGTESVMTGLQSIGSLLEGSGTQEQINDASFNLSRQVAGLQGDERSRAMEALRAQGDAGQNVIAGALSYSQRDRDMAGRGRGGARGARRTVGGLISGNSMSEMEFNVGGRAVRGQAGLDALLIGGNGAEAREAYVRQMQENLGTSSQNAGKLFDAYQAARAGTDQERDPTTGRMRTVQFNQRERDDLQRLADHGGVSDAGATRSQRAAEAANPLQAAANRTLLEIRDRLPAPAERTAAFETARQQLGFLETIATAGGLIPTGE